MLRWVVVGLALVCGCGTQEVFMRHDTRLTEFGAFDDEARVLAASGYSTIEDLVGLWASGPETRSAIARGVLEDEGHHPSDAEVDEKAAEIDRKISAALESRRLPPGERKRLRDLLERPGPEYPTGAILEND